MVGRLIGGLDGWLVSRKRRTGNQIGWNDDSVLRTLAVVTVGPFMPPLTATFRGCTIV